MIPFGYVVRDGKTVADEEKKQQIETFFAAYLSGLSQKNAAKEAGIPKGIAQRVLSNPIYLGTEVYPPILDQETFDKAQEMRERKNMHPPGHDRLIRKELPVEERFQMGALKRLPAKGRAEWLYGQITAIPEGRKTPNGYRIRMSSEDRLALMKRIGVKE